MNIFRFLIKISPQRLLKFLNYFCFSSMILVLFSHFLLRVRADFFALDQSMGLAWGHFTAFGCSAPLPGCAMDLLNSPGSILLLFYGGWYIILKTSHSILSTLSLEKKIWFKAKFEAADGKASRVLPLATNRQENWQGLIQSWPKSQRGLAEIAASQQSFGISTRLCQRRCEQL